MVDYTLVLFARHPHEVGGLTFFVTVLVSQVSCFVIVYVYLNQSHYDGGGEVMGLANNTNTSGIEGEEELVGELMGAANITVVFANATSTANPVPGDVL